MIALVAAVSVVLAKEPPIKALLPDGGRVPTVAPRAVDEVAPVLAPERVPDGGVVVVPAPSLSVYKVDLPVEVAATAASVRPGSADHSAQRTPPAASAAAGTSSTSWGSQAPSIQRIRCSSRLLRSSRVASTRGRASLASVTSPHCSRSSASRRRRSFFQSSGARPAATAT